MKRALVLGTLAAALSVGTAVATPPSGVTNNEAFQARGTTAEAYTITQPANMEIATQTVTFAATPSSGSTSGWHTHPGPVVTIVKSGTMKIWFSSDCVLRTLSAGQAIVVPGGGVYDLARNDDPNTPLVLVQTYHNLAVGGPLRTEAPGPQCQGGSSPAPADMGAVGLTGTVHSRVRIAPAINITGAANTDLMIQELTFAPGATAGWHSHPGTVEVQVQSGALTYQNKDCVTSQYPAGTGFIDDPTHGIHIARNDGTAAAVSYVTYTNLPVGGAARIDANAPACAAPAAAPTATPTPTPRPLSNTATDGIAPDQPPAPIAAAALLISTAVTLMSLAVVGRRRAG